MVDKNKVEVVIAGKTYTLVGCESEEYIKKVANYINEKMNMIMGADFSKSLNPTMVSVLMSINVADDLFKELEKNTTLEQEKKELGTKFDFFEEDFMRLQKENLYLKEKVSELQLEVLNAKNELDKFIEAFDEK